MTSGWDTYNHAVDAYRAVRPTYPTAVFDRIERYTNLPASPRVLEIGAGTGQATQQMAARGWRVLALEPGADLARSARAELAEFDTVDVRTSRFENAELTDNAFDLIAAATAWHWIDPTRGIPKAARLLRPDGAIALWWNAHVTDTPDPRWTPIRRVYEQVAPDLAHLAPLTPDRHDYDPAVELATSGLFDKVEQHNFPFSVTYTSNDFLALIATSASHRPLPAEARTHRHRELDRAINCDLGGVVTKPYNCFLVLAKSTKP